MEKQPSLRPSQPGPEAGRQLYQMLAVFYRKLLAALPGAAFLAEPQGQVLAVNQSLLELLDRERSALEGHDVSRIFQALSARSASPEKTQAMLEDARRRAAEKPVLDIDLKHPQAALLVWHFLSGRNLVGGEDLWGGLILDRSRENAYRRGQERILLQLGLAARKQAAALQGNLGALFQNINYWTPELIEEIILGSDRALEELVRLTDQLMIILQLEQRGGAAFPRPVSLDKFIKGAQEELNAKGLDQELKANLPPAMPQMYIDPALSKRVLTDLLVFAARAAAPGRAINLEVSTDEDFIRLQVDLPEEERAGNRDGPVELTSGTQWHRLKQVGRILQQAQGGDLEFLPSLPGRDQAGSALLTWPILPPEKRTPRSAIRPLQEQRPERILLAESHGDTLAFVRDELEREGFRVDTAASGVIALDMAQVIRPDLIILERDLPPLDGFQLLTDLRRWSSIPVVMISSREEDKELIRALESGADDYLRKPFLIAELTARVKALLRRTNLDLEKAPQEVFQIGDLRINFNTHQVWRGGNLLELTPLEYNLLAFLTRHPNQVLSYQQIINRVWEGPDKGSRQGLFVLISRLREKIEENPQNPDWIDNKWGVGYIFRTDSGG